MTLAVSVHSAVKIDWISISSLSTPALSYQRTTNQPGKLLSFKIIFLQVVRSVLTSRKSFNIKKEF